MSKRGFGDIDDNQDYSHVRTNTKRPKVDLDLAQIWERLANEDSAVRTNAAVDLLTKIQNEIDLDTARHIAKRLFRGLCSGRRAARLGFHVALAGALSLQPHAFGRPELATQEIVTILDQESSPESGTSGQDERDHHYGRMLGCKAVMDSFIAENKLSGQILDWERLADLLCGSAAKKPWLRPEAGYVLCQVARQLPRDPLAIDVINTLLLALKKHRLLQSREGIAFWLTVMSVSAELKPSPGLWPHDNPFDKRNSRLLAKVLLDSQAPTDEDVEIIGDAGWSPTLHFLWPLLLQYLSSTKSKSHVNFQQLWKDVVTDGFFKPEGTPERKHTGFQLLDTAIKVIPTELVQDCFSKNIMSAALQALRKADDSYLARTAQVTFDNITAECTSHPDRAIAVVKGMLLGSDFADFDTITKTKFMQTLLESVSPDDLLDSRIYSWLRDSPNDDNDATRNSMRRRTLLSVLQRVICSWISKCYGKTASEPQLVSLSRLVSTFLLYKFDTCHDTTSNEKFDEAALRVLREKTAQILDSYAKLGLRTSSSIISILSTLSARQPAGEDDVVQLVKQAWKRVTNMSNQIEGDGVAAGVAALVATILYQIYDDDEDAFPLLQEALSILEDFWDAGDNIKAADMLVETIVALVSKPSRFLRTIGTLIFQETSPLVSVEGLQPLTEILQTKEGREGQQNLFETGDNDEEEESVGDDGSDESESNDDSESGELDSDVEVVDVEDNSDDSDDGSSESDSEAESDVFDELDDDDNNETSKENTADKMNDLEKALAAALGTRKVNGTNENHDDDEESSDSDADMSDSEMIELDNKLSEVFKNQFEQTSAQRERTQELKNAKENVINLKNRALDLIEVFSRTQAARIDEALTLVIPLLQLTRTTSSKQVADRAKNILNDLIKRIRGFKASSATPDRVVSVLAELHQEVKQDDLSNEAIAIASKLNILLCRLSVESGEMDVLAKVDTMRRESKGKRRAHNEFWSRYDAWRGTVEERPVSADTNGKHKKMGGKKR